MTPEQTVLRALFLADPTASQLIHGGDEDFALADWFNTPTTFVVWKTVVTSEEIMTNGFDWTRVDNLSVGKARIWEWMFQFGQINASKANIRAGIDSVWVGTQADLDVRAAVYAHCKRFATRAEKALATGTGTTADPGILTYEGQLSYVDASIIRAV